MECMYEVVTAPTATMAGMKRSLSRGSTSGRLPGPDPDPSVFTADSAGDAAGAALLLLRIGWDVEASADERLGSIVGCCGL